MNIEIDYLWSHKCPKKWDQYTLVALVITIIILLILAGITISQLTESGLFNKTQEAEKRSKNAQEFENGILEDYQLAINAYINPPTNANIEKYTVTVTNGQFPDGTTSKEVNSGESVTVTAIGLPESGWSEWNETATNTKTKTYHTYAWDGETTKTITVTKNENIVFNYADTPGETKTKYKVSFDGYSDKDLWTNDSGDGTFIFPEGPSQSGYAFKGWSTNSNASSGTAAEETGTISTPTTYYATWTASTYKYIKWHITKHRVDAQGFNGALHVAEFKLLSKSGNTYNEYTFASGTTVTSNKAGYDSNQVIGKIIDGNISTKYFANWWASSDGTGDCTITITMPTAIDFSTYNYYAFYTAGDLAECDPATWKLYLSNTGNTNDWKEVDSKTNELVTETRSARTAAFQINL